MSKIRVLDEETICQIAAGEVVLDPLCACKELIENSIDSGAKKIEIQLKDGGKKLIRVSDDGSGMSPEDLRICTKKHATSKFESLYNIKSLGFRGEALFALEQVSDLKIVSKQEDAIAHTYYKGEVHVSSGNKGTVVEVKDLFKKTPARLKFLKDNEKEATKVKELIKSYSLAYPNISFIYKNETNTMNLSNNSIEQVMRIPLSEGIGIFSKEEEFEIHGWIFKREKGKSYFFVNGRLVQDNRIANVVSNVYDHVTGKKFRPPFVLFLKCPYGEVDVNVHPTKKEVRFASEDMYNKVYSAVHDSFSNWQAGSLEEVQKSMLRESVLGFNFSENLLRMSSEQAHINYDSEENFGTPIAQVFDKYIVCIKDNYLIFIDQHAAHERIIAEEIKQKEFEKQKLIIPIKIDLSDEQIEKFVSVSKKMESVITFSIIDNSIIIEEIVDFIDENYFNQALFNYLEEDKFGDHDFVCDYIHEFGCRNAMKAGQKLTQEEMKSLIKRLQNCKNKGFCNHGRRTFFKVTLEQLEYTFTK